MKHYADTLSDFIAPEREHMYLLKPTKKPSKHLSTLRLVNVIAGFSSGLLRKKDRKEYRWMIFSLITILKFLKRCGFGRESQKAEKWTKSTLSVLVCTMFSTCVFLCVFVYFLLASVAVSKHILICTFNLSNLLSSCCI